MADAISSIVVNDNASATLQKIGDALDKVTAAEARVATGTAAVTDQIVKSGRAADTAARQFESVARAADPVYAVQQKLTVQTTQLQRAVDLGVRSDAEALAVREKLAAQAQQTIQRLTGLTAAHADVTGASAKLTGAFALNRQGLLELQASGINAFQALASGMGVLRVAQTEGAQVVGALVQGGLNLKTAFSAIVSPAGVAATGIAVLAGGFALGAMRAAELEHETRDLTVALDGMGKSGQTSAAGLQKVRDQLVSIGLARSDASAAILAVARGPSSVPAQLAGQIITGAANESAIRGTDVLSETNALTQAIAGGAAGLEKYLIDRNSATAGDLAAMRQAERLGNQLQVVKIALDALDFSAGGKYQKSQSDWQIFWHAIGEVVDVVLDKLAKLPTAVGNATTALGNVTMLEGQLGVSLPLPARPSNEAPISPRPPNTAGVPGGDFASNFGIRPGVIMSGLVPQIADMLSHAAEQLPPGYSIEVTSGGRPGGSNSPVGMGSAHVPGLAADYQIVGPNGERLPNTGTDTSGLYGRTFSAAQAYAQWAYPQFNPRNGATFGANGGPISPTSPADIGHIDLRGAPGATLAGANDVQKLNEEFSRQVTILGSAQNQREALAAKEAAYNAELEKTHDAVAAANAGQSAYNLTVAKAVTTFGDETAASARATAGAGQVADAWVQSRAAALTAAAAVQAHEQASTKLGVSEGTLRQAILDRQAADLSSKAGETIRNTTEQIAATGALAKAELGGAAAVQEAERVEKVRLATRELSAAAEVTQDQSIRDRIAKQIVAINDLSLAETKADNTRAAKRTPFHPGSRPRHCAASKTGCARNRPGPDPCGQFAGAGFTGSILHPAALERRNG
jgi:hypothetical protein